ncbi:MAG: hypothetical protein GY765_43215 [bacterium]|nr:hypothetical protein [bacterium]
MKTTEHSDHNLFLIHDGTGDVDGYIEFVNNLHIPFNTWGIKADSLKNHAPENRNMEKTAEKYIGEIKTIQPRGPYVIAGWSLGGTIAFEMARQLEQMRNTVALTALIDSPPPGKYLMKNETAGNFTLKTETAWLKKQAAPSELLNSLTSAQDITQLWQLIHNFPETRDVAAKQLIQHFAHLLPGESYDRLNLEEALHQLNMSRTLSKARADYTPSRKLSGPIHYFNASMSVNINPEGWQKHCLQPLHLHEIQGDHYSIFKQPDVGPLARHFTTLIKKIVPLNNGIPKN